MNQATLSTATAVESARAYRRPATVAKQATNFAIPSPRDCAFIALQNAYRPHGGLARLRDLPAGGRVQTDAGVVEVEELVADRQLCAFEWHHSMWVPLFQFGGPGPTVVAAPQQVIAEWGPASDGWDVARWFVQSNLCLDGHSPIECLDTRLNDVLDAARTDRYVAMA